jgi:hypothetical protein
MPVIRKLALLLLVSSPVWASCCNSTMNWDVRTTGSDNNGGGFDSGVASPGTDFSLQNAAQQAYTDIVIGGTTTQITSAAHAFGSTHPGNVINITGGAGCTTGRYEVISVSGVTATMDHSLGTAASTCTGNLGGSLATWDPAITAVGTGGGKGQTIHIKSGTYTRTTTTTVTATNVLQFVGYGTTHWDNGTKPLITTATNSTPLFFVGGANYQVFRHLSLSNTAATRSYGFKSNVGGAYNYVTLIDCVLDGFSWGVIADNTLASAGYVMLIGTEIKNGTLGGASAWWALVSVNSYIHDNTGPGLQKTSNQNDAVFDVSFSVIARNTHGLDVEADIVNCHWINNTIASNTSDGIFIFSGANNEYITLENNILYGNTGYGLNWASGTTAAFDFVMNTHNAWGGNTTADVNNYTKSLDGTDFTLGSDPFINKASGNFGLVTGSALLKAAYPGQSFPGGSVSYQDVGAIQTSGSPATCGGTFACGFSLLRQPELR